MGVVVGVSVLFMSIGLAKPIFLYCIHFVAYFYGSKNGIVKGALRTISWKQNNVRLILVFLGVCYWGARRRRGGGRGYFAVLNSLADTCNNPRFGRFVSLRAAGSDLSEKAWKSQNQRAKKKKLLSNKCYLAILAWHKYAPDHMNHV